MARSCRERVEFLPAAGGCPSLNGHVLNGFIAGSTGEETQSKSNTSAPLLPVLTAAPLGAALSQLIS
jgi:hypothetical protein